MDEVVEVFVRVVALFSVLFVCGALVGACGDDNGGGGGGGGAGGGG